MHEVVDVLRPHQKRGDNLAAVDLLARTVDHTRLHQRQQPVREHLGVNPQIPAVGELRQHRVGNLPDAELKTGAVVNQLRTVPPDHPLRLVRQRERHRLNRTVVLDDIIDLIERNHAVAVTEGNVTIHHRNHRAGALDRGRTDIHRCAERNKTVAVRTRNLHHRHVTGQAAGTEELLRLMQRHRNVIGVARLHLPPDVAADEEGLRGEDSGILRRRVVRRLRSVDVAQLHIGEAAGAGARAKRIHQHFGNRPGTAQIDRIAAADELYGLRRSHHTVFL